MLVLCLNGFPAVARRDFLADLLTGLTGAFLVQPQGVLCVTLAGMPPRYGFVSL